LQESLIKFQEYQQKTFTERDQAVDSLKRRFAKQIAENAADEKVTVIEKQREQALKDLQENYSRAEELLMQ